MTDDTSSDRLTSALSDRYTLDRELGQGGMAVVYLAQDRKLDRPVALKVLRPELAASLGADRFLREIQIASKLSHPNILGLFDCGEADGLLYYTMPYVEGETLRERMNREKQLPLEDALQITREVAGALGHAHEQGLVHRDVKPENILFQGGHAVVADFGIARALTEAGGTNLTETGLAVGTPAYMSPEQAAGSSDVDGRADLYSLGCVLYEMLSGDAPYMASTPMAVIAKKLSEPIPHISVVREAVPGSVEAALTKALAKNAADRFRTAEQFTAALAVDTAAFERKQKVRRRVRRVAMGAAALVVLAAAGIGLARYRAATDWKRVELDPNKVAVMPFRVTVTDENLRGLEALPHLLAGVLDGELGPDPVEFSILSRRWEDWESRGLSEGDDGPIRLAASFGAGLVIDGAATQAGAEVVVTGTLREVPTGAVLAPHTLTVSTDSVQTIPRLLIQGLLGARLGEDQDRLELFERQNPDAVWLYLEGVTAEHRGDFDRATQAYRDAIAIDSTFAVAALRLYRAAQYGTQTLILGGALRLAEAYRDRLGRRDRAALEYALAGSSAGSAVARLRAAESWIAEVKDDPEAWVAYGYALSRAGPLLGLDGWVAGVRDAWMRGWSLDSTHVGLIKEELYFAVDFEDWEWVEQILPQYLSVGDSTNGEWHVWRWAFAQLSGDTVTERLVRARFLEEPQTTGWTDPVWTLTWLGLSTGSPLDDVDSIVARASRRGITETEEEAQSLSWYTATTGWARGRAQEVGEYLLDPNLQGWRRGDWLSIEAWLVHPGFDSAAAVAVEGIETRIAEGGGDIHDQCALLLYRSVKGDTLGAWDAALALEERYEDLSVAPVCPAQVRAFLETLDPTREESPALDHLEGILRQGPSGRLPKLSGFPLLARLRRARGEYQRALELTRVIRSGNLSLWIRPALRKEEGDLSVILGDTATAVRAYTEYLSFRTEPDPGPMQAQVDSVRAALTALEAAWSGHD